MTGYRETKGKVTMRIRKAIGAGAALVLAATALWAHSGATGIVKQRMDAMVDIGKAMKVLAPMMQGKTAYDAPVVRAAAERIAGHAGDHLVMLFPEGTDGAPSEARPEIWTDPEGFAALAARMETLSRGLDLAAGNRLSGAPVSPAAFTGAEPLPDPDAFADMPPDVVFGMLGRTCMSCHSAYRIKKD